MNNLSDKTVTLFQLRIKSEEMSSRIYLQMSNGLDAYGFTGAAKLWKKYSEEELIHANKAYQFLLDLDYIPESPYLEKPDCYEGDLKAIIKASYLHEQKITAECKELYIETQKNGDILGVAVALWYVNEQIEELSKTKFWMDRLDLLGGDSISKDGLYLLDREMGETVNLKAD